MFVKIETKGATHILINIPTGVYRSLAQLSAMLEINAVFINDGWSGLEIVKPEMTAVLSDRYTHRSNEGDVVMMTGQSAIDEGFEIASPEVFTSNKEAMKKKQAEVTRLLTEVNYLKGEVARLTEQLIANSNDDKE